MSDLVLGVISFILVTLVGYLITWLIKRDSRRESARNREMIKAIVDELLKDAMQSHTELLHTISNNVSILMEAREELNRELMRRIFKDFK